MWSPENYTVAALLLPRLLGCIYFFAIGPFIFQILGLLGENGILPAKDYLSFFRTRYPYKRFLFIPSLFWINATDLALIGAAMTGTLLSVLLFLGFYPSLLLAILFFLYLSIVSIGQDFLSFGWESLLLEITFYAFWLSLTPVPNLLMWICLNFLLLRFHYQAGSSKLQSFDRSWRDLTALSYHYQTQPLPNTWAWYVHKWPMSFHRASTLMMFVIELVFPFGLLFGDEVRAITGAGFIGLQVIIWLTGNLSYLNHMTAAFSTIAFSNAFFPQWMAPQAQTSPSPFYLEMLISFVGALFLALQLLRYVQHFSPFRAFYPRWFTWLSLFHLVNRYGLFAVMTKERIEIVIEGSEDGENWKEYLCKYKPSEIARRPRRISPYQPRLDWQMWFLPFSEFEGERWFQQFLFHLLKGTPSVLKLVRYNPFSDKPPKYIRSLMYDYQFSSKKQKKQTGEWWKREFVGFYSPVMSLRENQF